MTTPLRLAAIAEGIEWPEHDPAQAAREHRRPELGRLAALGEWISGVQGRYPPRALTRARLVVFAADHGVVALGVSRDLPPDTARVAGRLAAGTDQASVFADVAGVGPRVVDVGMATPTPFGVDDRALRRGSGRIDREDALTPDEVAGAVGAGAAVADQEVDAGADLLVVGTLGAGATTTAATLVAVVCDVEPVKVVGRGSGIDDDAWMRKVTAVRDARRRAMDRRADPDGLLTAVGGADLAAVAGFVLQAARRRTPVVLDGLVTTAGALVAHEAAPRAMRWWLAGPASPEPAHAVALTRLGLEPVFDLGLTTQRGCGALTAVPLLRSAIGALGVADADHG